MAYFFLKYLLKRINHKSFVFVSLASLQLYIPFFFIIQMTDAIYLAFQPAVTFSDFVTSSHFVTLSLLSERKL